jgi:transposase
MKPDIADLPDDARLSMHDIASLLEVVEKKYEEKIHYLEERIRLLQGELYGRKSEKRYPEDSRQLPIFEQDRDDQGILQPAIDDTIIVPAHRRGKRGRKPLPENLPRVKVIHDLAEEDKMCACGAPLSRIGQDICEKLDYIPAKVRVLRHVRFKYACKACEGVEDAGPTVKIAPAPGDHGQLADSSGPAVQPSDRTAGT